MSEEESSTSEQVEELETRRVGIDEDGDEIVEVPVGVFIAKSPKKVAKRRKKTKIAKKAKEEEEKEPEEEEYEEGIEYEFKKVPAPRYGLEEDEFNEMSEFWGMKLVGVPYRRKIMKEMKLGYTGKVQLKKTGLGYIPYKKRGKSPLALAGDIEDILYETIPEEEMEEAIEAYKKEYSEQYGGNPEDVAVPYMTPTRQVDFSKKTTEELLRLCRSRGDREWKKACNTMVQEIAEEYGEADEEERDAAIRNALIRKIESSLAKAKVVPRVKAEYRGKYEKLPSPKSRFKPRRNPYNKRYPIGARVEFIDGKGVTRKGLVRAFAKPGITVMADRIEFKIKYANKTLKVIDVSPEKTSPGSPERREVAMFQMTEIPKSLRERVIEVYTELLTEIRGVTDAPAKTVKVPEFTLVAPVPWEEYYESNFHAWRWQMYSGIIEQGLDMKAINRYIKEESDNARDYNMLLENVLGLILDNLGEQITTETTAEDVIRAFNIKKHLTPFEAKFLENFTRLYNAHRIEEEGKLGMGKFATPDRPERYIERRKFQKKEEKKQRRAKGAYQKAKTPEELKTPKLALFPEKPAEVPSIKGERLAQMIDVAIREYINIVPDISRELIIQDAIKQGLEAYDQKVLRKMFDDQYLEEMKKTHADYDKFYAKEYDKHQDALEEAKAKGDVKDVNSSAITEEVKKFEEIVYLNHGRGKNVYRYLRRVLIPYVFMHGPIAKHAKFFRAKLANGMFSFAALAHANIAHFLPEFVMGIKDHTDAEIDALFAEGPWWTLRESFDSVRHILIKMFMDSYISILNPMMQRKMTNYLDNLWHAGDPLVKILVTPVSACQRQTGTGIRQVIQNNEYVYRAVGRGPGKHLIPDMEDIPEGDLVICFDQGKFSCLSVRDIAIAIVKAGDGKPINTQTEKPYPADFIKRFSQQHSAVIDEIRSTGVPSDEGRTRPLPKTPTPPKPVKAAPKKKSVMKKRHSPVKGKKFKEVTGLLLIGDEIDNIPGYKEELEVPLEGDDTLMVSLENKRKSANVAVISVTVDSEGGPDMGLLADQLSKVSSKIKDVYVLGVGEIAGKYRTIYSARIKKMKEAKNIKQIFYASKRDEEDIMDALIDVVIDVEGVKVRGVGKKAGGYDPSKLQEEYAPFWSPEGGWRMSEKEEKERPAKKRSPKKVSPVRPRKMSPGEAAVRKWGEEFGKVQEERSTRAAAEAVEEVAAKKKKKKVRIAIPESPAKPRIVKKTTKKSPRKTSPEEITSPPKSKKKPQKK